MLAEKRAFFMELLMARINIIGSESAESELKEQYELAENRAGRIWNIISIMSQNPAAMRQSMEFYIAIMFGKSPLSRGQREMLAVIVSTTNRCVY